MFIGRERNTMRRFVLGLVLVFSTVFVSSAWADDGSGVAEEPAVGLKLSPVDWARENDAMNDRGSFYLQHADTIGEGKTSFSALYFVFMGITHSPSKNFQFSVHTLPPIASGMPLVLFMSGKYIVSRGANSVMSAVLDVSYVSESGHGGGIFRVGMSGDHFMGAEGRTSVHWNFSLLGGLGDASAINEFDGQFFVGGVGVTHRMSRKFSLIAEGYVFGAHSKGEFVTSLDIDGHMLIPLFYGARFTSNSLSAEVLFMKPIGVETGPLIMGIPYLAFGYRW
jgi:hypothetical protein